jgi:hypothetical protein
MGRWLDLIIARRPVAAPPSRQRGALFQYATGELHRSGHCILLAVSTVVGPAISCNVADRAARRVAAQVAAWPPKWPRGCQVAA